MKRRLVWLCLLSILLLTSGVISAQGNEGVQEFIGVLEGGEDARFTYYDIFGARDGETIYVYVESDEIDPYVLLCDIDCSDIFAENDDIDADAGNYNSAFSYTFTDNGDYSIAVSDCCEEANTGEFRLLLAYGVPDVLDGTAQPTGAEIAVPYDPNPSFPADLTLAPITGDPQVQEFYAIVAEDVEFSYFDLFGMQAGETIYIYVESDDIDPLLFLCDIDCEETFAENDDIDADAGNFNSTISYTFTDDGDYSIAVTDCCRSDVEGVFHLTIGFNAPEVLIGDAVDNGARIAIPYEPTYFPITPESSGVASDVQVQQVVGEITADESFTYYDIFDAVGGETLYLYAESDEIDPYLIVCDIFCEEIYADNDDISQRNVNSAIEFTFPEDGDYSIAVADCCNEEATGSFLLQLGYNAPEVLTGNGIPNGAVIMQEYQPMRTDVADVERDVSASCEELELGERPELSGAIQTVGTENFLIHYTTVGQDAADEAFVDEVLTTVEDVLEVQIDRLGWPAPPRDCGEGGDTRFDLYLADLFNDGILGYAQPENIIGDNANSDLAETWAGYSFMVIDNDFRGANPSLSVMRATVAHEFHHTIQFGYDVNDPGKWYYEATGSWIETQTSPQDEDATGYTQAIALYPDLCIGTLDEDTGERVYGEWVLIDSIVQDLGQESIIRMWEYIADYEGMDAYYNMLSEFGTTPQDVLRRYAVRNLLRDYALGGSFPATVNIEAIVDGTGTIEPDSTGVEELSADYVLIRRRGNYTFSVNQSNLSLIVVGIDKGSGMATVFDLGQRGTVDTTAFSNTYLIVANNDEHNDVNNCSVTNWEVEVSDGSGSAQTPANGETFNAVNFIPAG